MTTSPEKLNARPWRNGNLAFEIFDALATSTAEWYPNMTKADIEPALYLLDRLFQGYKEYGSVYSGKVNWKEWGTEELADMLNYKIWGDLEARGRLPKRWSPV